MSDEETPEAGERCKVTTGGGGEEVAVWTGFMWASEDGGRVIDGAEVKSWEAAPSGGDLEVKMPDGETQKVTPEFVGSVEAEDPDETGES